MSENKKHIVLIGGKSLDEFEAMNESDFKAAIRECKPIDVTNPDIIKRLSWEDAFADAVAVYNKDGNIDRYKWLKVKFEEKRSVTIRKTGETTERFNKFDYYKYDYLKRFCNYTKPEASKHKGAKLSDRTRIGNIFDKYFKLKENETEKDNE